MGTRANRLLLFPHFLLFLTRTKQLTRTMASQKRKENAVPGARRKESKSDEENFSENTSLKSLRQDPYAEGYSAFGDSSNTPHPSGLSDLQRFMIGMKHCKVGTPYSSIKLQHRITVPLQLGIPCQDKSSNSSSSARIFDVIG